MGRKCLEKTVSPNFYSNFLTNQSPNLLPRYFVFKKNIDIFANDIEVVKKFLYVEKNKN